MGLMDKAKKLAEQAQQKLDETQTQFNQKASPQAQPGGGPHYDEDGRPVEPSAADSPTPDPAMSEPDAGPDAPRPDPNAPGGADHSPDPFKPLQ